MNLKGLLVQVHYWSAASTALMAVNEIAGGGGVRKAASPTSTARFKLMAGCRLLTVQA